MFILIAAAASLLTITHVKESAQAFYPDNPLFHLPTTAALYAAVTAATYATLTMHAAAAASAAVTMAALHHAAYKVTQDLNGMAVPVFIYSAAYAFMCDTDRIAVVLTLLISIYSYAHIYAVFNFVGRQIKFANKIDIYLYIAAAVAIVAVSPYYPAVAFNMGAALAALAMLVHTRVMSSAPMDMTLNFIILNVVFAMTTMFPQIAIVCYTFATYVCIKNVPGKYVDRVVAYLSGSAPRSCACECIYDCTCECDLVCNCKLCAISKRCDGCAQFEDNCVCHGFGPNDECAGLGVSPVSDCLNCSESCKTWHEPVGVKKIEKQEDLSYCTETCVCSDGSPECNCEE